MGRVTFYDYLWTGQLSSVMLPDPDGSGPLPIPIVSHDYDSLGRQVSQSQNGTVEKSVGYNTAGQVVSETLADPDGTGPLTAATSVYSYDALGRMVQTTMPGGAVRSVSYDSIGNVLSVTDPDPDGAGPQIAATTSFTYDALGRTTAMTDALGGITSFLWNAAGYQIGTTNALGHSTSVTYDAAGRKTSTTNELGATTAYAYNAIGKVTSVTMPDPDGSGALPAPVISSTYDLLGRTVSVTAPNGAVSSVQYDNMGRTIQQTAPDGSYITMAYNAAGQVTSQSQHAAGNTTVITSTLTYDALGRILTAIDPAGTSSFAFDANGNRSSVTDATGRTTTLVYDAWSRPVQTTDGSGNQSKVTYNAFGQVASTTDGLNHVTTFGYDLAGRLITSTDSNGGVTSTKYDRLGRTTKLTDPNGNITTWTYDAMGRLLTDSQGLSASAMATRSYAYDPAGRLLSRTDRNGRAVTFSYDHLGRQTQQNWLVNGTSTNTITTTYNAAMYVASITDNDSALAFTWDSMGRLLSSSNAGTANAPTVTLSQTFNALGLRATKAATINGIADFLNTYTYDSEGRLSQLTQQDGDSSAGYGVTSKRVDLSYDAVGRFSGISRYQSLTTSQALASSAYLYDAAGRLTSLQHTGMENGATASNPLAGYTFAWDSADRLTSVDSVRDGLVNYSYDSTGQVTRADFTGQTDETFAYDDNGNRTTVAAGSASGSSVTIGLHNRVLNDGKFTYTYDAEGNRTSKTDNLTGSRVEYEWNHANLLTTVAYKTSNNVVTKSVSYQYDALGRRIGKSVDDAVGSNGSGNGTVDRRESYIYDGAGLLASAAGSIHISGPNGVMGQHGWVDQMVLSFIDTDGDSSSPSQLASRNLYGDAVDQIFATDSGSGDVFWALTDHQGTPRDWTTRSASGTTTIAQHTRYTAFGAIESVVDGSGASLATSNSLLASFTGQLHDPDADLLYYRARWFDPQLGKFLSDDPMGFEAGDANVSRCVGNASAIAADPSGLDRLLTPNERQAIEYIYKSVMPRIQKTHLNQMLAETLAEVTLIDIDTTPWWVVIPRVSILDNGYAACTLGESQYYRNVPRPDDPVRFALIAHETMHSFHEEMITDTTWMFLVGYLGDSFTAWIYDGEAYKKNMSEMMAYAMTATVEEMMNDPAFKNAVVNGTTGQLPETYRDKMRTIWNQSLSENMHVTSP